MSLKKPLIVVSEREVILPLHLAEKLQKLIRQDYPTETDKLTVRYCAHVDEINQSVSIMIETVKELIESNDRLTKALIDSYSEPDGEEVPRTYMDGTKVN